VPDTHYYTLALPGTPRTKLSGRVAIVSLTADAPYATAPIVYRSSEYQLDYYTYHRWAADPREVVANAMRDYLERAGTGDGVPYEIEGHLRRLEEIDSPAGWQGAVTLDLRVKRAGVTLIDQLYVGAAAAGEKTPAAVVAAISRALNQILDAMLEELAAARGSSRRP
jgi:uncharacterized lipoprotein YmbA